MSRLVPVSSHFSLESATWQQPRDAADRNTKISSPVDNQYSLKVVISKYNSDAIQNKIKKSYSYSKDSQNSVNIRDFLDPKTDSTAYRGSHVPSVDLRKYLV